MKIFLALREALITWFLPIVPAAIASVAVSDDEVNACAAIRALKDYRRRYDFKNEVWMLNGRSEEEAMEGFIVDNGTRPNFIAIAHSYDRYAKMGMPTVYHTYVNEGRHLAIKKKLLGEKIEFPKLKVRDGYHVTRLDGVGGALVKDGESEPVFECAKGYRYSGSVCVPD